MKRIKYLIFTLLTGLFVTNVNAASAYLSTNKSTIENGSSVTASVSMKGAAAWNITISSDGSTTGCTQKFADATSDGNNTNKTFSVTCKSSSLGIISFNLSGDITASDGTNIKLSGFKRVIVTTPRAKSTNNNLSSLSVDGYTLSPAFSADVVEYSLTVPSTIDKININATLADNYASISGNGEQTLESGTNNLEVVVTSETGVSKTYKITVNVQDLDPIKVTIGKENYTVVKEARNLTKPELFDETTVTIGKYTIPAFVNKVCNYTLVGLKNSSGKINLFIYKDGKYYKYDELTDEKLNLVILNMAKQIDGFKKKIITINEKKVDVYENSNTSLKLVYAVNIVTGKKNYYTYDEVEKTFQIFDKTYYEKNLKNQKSYKMIIIGCGVLVAILLVITILTASNNHKFKKLNKNISNKNNDVDKD